MSAGTVVQVRRVVTVTRPTDYALLLDRHGTRGQVEFVVRDRGGSLEELDRRHDAQERARRAVAAAIPRAWRRASVTRADLDRFLFEPDDIVVAVGQDGLVPNVAKYLDGQPVVGVDPEPDVPARLMSFRAEQVAATLVAVDDGAAAVRELTMVQAELQDGPSLRALNEVFVGHRTHQSARYEVAVGGESERQSSSGLIVTTGTGGTGWASSIHRATQCELPLPAPTDPDLLLLVREAWPSPTTGADLVAARVDASATAEVVSRMDQGGIVFGDGIESDPLPFDYARRLTIRPADHPLRLVVTTP